VSEVPCGDASMGLLSSTEESSTKKREQKFNEKVLQGHWSGAKTIEGGMSQ
jgi:hypothetical protein